MFYMMLGELINSIRCILYGLIPPVCVFCFGSSQFFSGFITLTNSKGHRFVTIGPIFSIKTTFDFCPKNKGYLDRALTLGQKWGGPYFWDTPFALKGV